MLKHRRWFVKAAGLVTMVTAAISEAQPAKRKAVFRQRDFVVQSAPPAGLAAGTNAVKTAYDSVDFERSLLVADCGSKFVAVPASSWCQHRDFQFAAVLERAAATTGNSASKLSADWWAAMASQKPPLGEAAKLAAAEPFHLLAVVNRLDMASPDGSGPWRDGEVRFVYGVKNTFSDKSNMTVIVEFVLKPMEWRAFHAMNGVWRGLSTIAIDHANFPERLKGAVDESLRGGVSSVRFRVNDGRSGGRWAMGEWHLGPQLPLRRAKLEHEFDGRCAYGLSGCPSKGDYEKYWQDLKKIVDPRKRASTPIPSTVRTKTGDTGGKKDFGLSTPAGMCDADLEVRRLLGLRQCTSCHGGETKTEFMHVENRKTDHQRANLSKFLTGGMPKPSFEQTSTGDPAIAFEPEVTFANYYGPSEPCTALRNDTTKRAFHDLARRAMFLASVLALPASAAPTKDQIEEILDHGPDFAH